MGMYTELYIALQLKSDVPDIVINTLRYMFDAEETHTEPDTLPEHPLFQCDRWRQIGSMSSYYFVPHSVSIMRQDIAGGLWCIISRSDLKNYDNEILKFLDWITPYVDACEGDHLGHHRYEEREQPTLLYYKTTEFTLKETT